MVGILNSGLGPIGFDEVFVPDSKITTTIITTYGPKYVTGYHDVRTSTLTRTFSEPIYNTTSVFDDFLSISRYTVLTDFAVTTTTRLTTYESYGLYQTLGSYTTTSTSTIYGRALPTPAPGDSGTANDDAPAAAPTPAPTPLAAQPHIKRARSGHERHELVKRRRGGSSSGGGGGDGISETAKFALQWDVPTFLGLFWSFAVILWMLILPCVGVTRPLRSIAWMSKALLWFGLIGFAISLWFSIAVGVFMSEEGALMTGLRVCILVFSWLLTVALLATWFWLRLWGRKHANGQLNRSIESVEDDNAAGVVVQDTSNLKVDDPTPPPHLAYAVSNTSYSTPTPTGTDLTQPYNQPQQPYNQPQPLYNQPQQPYSQPASPPPGPPAPPAGYVYALVPAPNGTSPSPPNMYPANMNQPQPVPPQGYPQGYPHP